MADAGDVPTKQEARAAFSAAMIAALGMTRSKARAEEIVQDAFEKVMTTRPWSRKDRTFEQHMVGVVWSLSNHAFTSAKPKQDAEAAEGFHREEVGTREASPEDKALERAEHEGRATGAEQELDALEAACADNTNALAVLRCRREHGLVKAGEIAEKLGMPVEQVYRANEALRERLKTLRKRREKDGAT